MVRREPTSAGRRSSARCSILSIRKSPDCRPHTAARPRVGGVERTNPRAADPTEEDVKRELNPKMLYFGTPVVLVSSLNEDGSTNIAPMSSAWWVGNTAMLGLSSRSQTVINLLQRPACVLNLVDEGMVDAIDRLALLTGRPDVPEYKQRRGYTYEPDKFTAAGLTPQSFGAGMPAGVAESPIHMEGTVQAAHDIDGPDSGLLALEVAVLRTHVEDSLLMT